MSTTTPCTVNGLRLRRVLGRDVWWPPERFGPDGWWLTRKDRTATVIVSTAPFGGVEWTHASIARHERVPDYADLVLLHRAVFNGGWAYQVFAPPSQHVNIHENALHLWGRADGAPALPAFAEWGSI